MVTSSNGQVGTPDLFSGIIVSLIQTSVFKLLFILALFHVPSVARNISLIFTFFIAHFLPVENINKNPYSLKAVKTVISEARFFHQMEHLFFHCKSARCFNILLFQPMDVS
jgi:hypothetical protein